MKFLIAVVLPIFLLTGCSKSENALDRAILLRNKLLQSNGCTFDAIVTADYGEKLYSFSMSCQSDSTGNLTFTVIAPSSLSGITGKITEEGGKLTFADQALAFEMLADGQITPVSAPWLFLKTLRSGYLNAQGIDGNYTKLSIDDSYRDDALHLDVWLNQDQVPIRGEILWQGRRIISIEVDAFKFL